MSEVKYKSLFPDFWTETDKGLIISGCEATSIIHSCRNNSPIAFSTNLLSLKADLLLVAQQEGGIDINGIL